MDANFDLSRFDHEARWNAEARRVEMHLRARNQMTVTIGKAQLRIDLQEGETIKTEDSYKFELEEIRALTQRSGFSCQQQWVDGEWAFSQSLLVAC